MPESEAPPDRWASSFAPKRIGTHVPPAFPTAQEKLGDPTRRNEVLRGRRLVLTHACADCHGGGRTCQAGWLPGFRGDAPDPDALCDYCFAFPIGPFTTRPRNLIPDNLTGIGRGQ